VFRRDATKLGLAPPGEAFTLAFLDPPYGKLLAPLALNDLLRGGWLAPGALVVIEEAAGAALNLPVGLVREDARRYGDTQIIFARRES
jgi:16S rRNA (guanine966-N2)-methyltransferase